MKRKRKKYKSMLPTKTEGKNSTIRGKQRTKEALQQKSNDTYKRTI